jgi:hypothetical protein
LMGPEWWFPWYDNVGMTTWVLIGNPSSTQTAQCTVYIGVNAVGSLISQGTLTIEPLSRVTPQYDGVITGPVKVLCDKPVYVSERALFSTSFNEVLGTPPSAFNKTQWFPWYDQQGMHTWVHIGNPSSVASEIATCDVYVGVNPQTQQLVKQGTYDIYPSKSQPPQYIGLIGGPVKVDCNRPVYASERAIFQNSFNEVVAIPQSQLGADWWFPWYEGLGMHMWVLIGNPSSTNAVDCALSVAGVPKTPQTIGPNSSVIPQYSLSDGPVHITCNGQVYATERAVYQSSFSEMAGLQAQ